MEGVSEIKKMMTFFLYDNTLCVAISMKIIHQSQPKSAINVQSKNLGKKPNYVLVYIMARYICSFFSVVIYQSTSRLRLGDLILP
jgi:hypothetical protein